MAKIVPNTQTGSLTDHQHGSDDTLVGGNDTPIAGASNVLYGDAIFMDGNSQGGDDTIVSGPGTDHMGAMRSSSTALRRHPRTLPALS